MVSLHVSIKLFFSWFISIMSPLPLGLRKVAATGTTMPLTSSTKALLSTTIGQPEKIVIWE